MQRLLAYVLVVPNSQLLRLVDLAPSATLLPTCILGLRPLLGAGLWVSSCRQVSQRKVILKLRGRQKPPANTELTFIAAQLPLAEDGANPI
jgi:hypothetical protein